MWNESEWLWRRSRREERVNEGRREKQKGGGMRVSDCGGEEGSAASILLLQ